MTKFLLVSLMSLLFSVASAQKNNDDNCNSSSIYYYWTGEFNNDFFNEKNWRQSNENPAASKQPGTKPTCLPGSNSYPYAICVNEKNMSNDKNPKAGSIDPGTPIAYNLLIENAIVNANGYIVFACAQKGLTLVKSQLNVVTGSFNKGTLSLLAESTVHLREGEFSTQLTLNFLDDASWVYMHQSNPNEVAVLLDHIMVNNVAGILDNNFRVNQFYQSGSIIRPQSLGFAPLTLFSETNKQGNSAELREDIIYIGSGIPNGLDNSSKSFVLKRGYQATLAINENGTGKSRVFIASETDLTVNTMDLALENNVSFVRVVPFNWVTKKGTGGSFTQLDAGWYYNWGLGSNSLPNYEYVPMAWGAGGALPASINQMIQKKKTTHVLGFNESDNCEDQSGKFNNLCQPEVAVAYYENLMGLGVRLGTPAPRENGPTGWLNEFNRIAKQRDVRFDFVAVHWYDWGSNPANSPNASAEQIFNRFKSYLQNVYNIYKLPIWITEFNANPNRPNATQEAFLRLALPYLESLSYVERYAYFQPMSQYASVPTSSANYLNNDGSLTNIGTLYKEHNSTPSIQPANLICSNNLDGMNVPYVAPILHTMAFEAECGKFLGNQWTIQNSEDASNGLFIQGDNNLPGATTLAKQVHFEFDLETAGTYRTYIRSMSVGAGSIKISMDGAEFATITPLTSGSFTWLQIPRFFTLGVGKHRLSIEFPNGNILFDQLVVSNGIQNWSTLKQAAGYCTPSSDRFGITATDMINFHEAETSSKGLNWQVETSSNARGGAYLKSDTNISSSEAPTGTDKVMNFVVQITEADEYDIWAKLQANVSGANSLWIAVDDEPFRLWNNVSNTSYEWYWKKFHYSYGSEDRPFTHFLSAGTHQVKIAIASGAVSVDRLAIASKGKLPENTDANVLLLTEKLNFEAEDATLIKGLTGTGPVIVNCPLASNGKVVNINFVTGNIIRFDQIVAEQAGAYTLKLSYVNGGAVRTFKLTVNGYVYAAQRANTSGAWCAANGGPAIYEVVVNLKRGLNTIDISPFSGEAPFVDKIQLVKAPLNGLSLEAETAELLGAPATTTCSVSSNGAFVNMFANVSNGIRFNNLLAQSAKRYAIDIYYISKVSRNLRYSLNGQSLTTISVDPSGNWCFEPNPSVKIKTIEVDFELGNNNLLLRPAGTDAPMIDRIVIREIVQAPAENAIVPTAAINSLIVETSINKELSVYPNPVQANTAITVSLPSSITKQGNVLIQVNDISGRAVFAQPYTLNGTNQVKINKGFEKGMYIISARQGTVSISRKIIIQ